MFNRRLSPAKIGAPAPITADMKVMPEATTLQHTALMNLGFSNSDSLYKKPIDTMGIECGQGRMDTLLQMIQGHLDVSKRGAAYEMVERCDSMTVEQKQDMLQRFLRVNSFDPAPAAKQIIAFYEMKFRLFGKDKVLKEITIDDLSEEDRRSLRSGSLQLLSSEKDIQNRRILLSLPGRRVFKSIENELRANFYLIMSALKLQEVQKDGLVYIRHAIGRYKDRSNGFGYAENSLLLGSLPVQLHNIHMCVDDYAQHLLESTNQLPPALSAKVIVHSGSEMECLFELFKCGIPRGCLPPADGSDHPWMDAHLVWCNSREVFDSSLKLPLKYGIVRPKSQKSFRVQDRIAKPRDLDVLFGSDHKSHPGSMKFHMLINHLQHQYEDADRDGKVLVSLIAVFSMKGTGSRFLDYDDVTQQWREIPDTRARNKVTKMIRNRRRYKKRRRSSSP
ncbi:MAG: hypothetical protein SGBAC_007010 [Bacillariaceae sp.]